MDFGDLIVISDFKKRYQFERYVEMKPRLCDSHGSSNWLQDKGPPHSLYPRWKPLNRPDTQLEIIYLDKKCELIESN